MKVVICDILDFVKMQMMNFVNPQSNSYMSLMFPAQRHLGFTWSIFNSLKFSGLHKINECIET